MKKVLLLIVIAYFSFVVFISIKTRTLPFNIIKEQLINAYDKIHDFKLQNIISQVK